MILPLITGYQSNVPLQDIPRNHWIYVGIAYMKRAGLMVGFPDFMFGRRPPLSSRDVAAVITHVVEELVKCDVSLTDQRDWLLTARRDDSWSESLKQAKEFGKDRFVRASGPFIDRFLETYPEAFKALGQSPADLRERADYAFRHIRSLRFPE